jgi:hypothetical protein
MVRSTSSTALSMAASAPLWPMRTMCWAASMALVEGREVHHAQHLGARQFAQLQPSANLVRASVPSLPTSRCARLTLPSPGVGALVAGCGTRPGCSHPPGAAPWASSLIDLRAPRSRASALHLQSPIWASGPCSFQIFSKSVQRARRRSRPARPARCAPCCRRQCCGCRTSCCRPCPPAWPARWWTHPPGTTGRGLRSAAFRWSSTMPGLHFDGLRACHIHIEHLAHACWHGQSPALRPPSARTGWCRPRAARWARPDRGRCPCAICDVVCAAGGTNTPTGVSW